MKAEIKMRPILRFREFNDSWAIKKGIEITSKITKGSSPKWQGFSYQKSGVLFVTSENVRDGYLDVSKPKYLPPSFHKKHKNGQLKKGDILINIVGASIGRCCIYDSQKDASTNQAVALFRVSQSFELQFISQCYQQERIQQVIRGTQSDSARPNLSLTDLREMKFIVPSLPEQQKIADFLTAVDGRIQQLIQKKALLQDYKKGVMQQLFTQALRFKDDHGNDFPDWEEKRLGEVCRVKKGAQLNKEQLEDIGLYPAINGGVSPSGFTGKFNTRANTITISEGGNSCGFVNYIKTNFWSGGHCYSLENLSSSIRNNFLFQVLKCNERRIMALRVGSGLPNIQKKDINNFSVILPTVSEQTKIADFLSAIDRKIDNVTTQITETQTFKKGLLQQMFV